MIKIFRKIRHNLLSENRFSRYLLYAIGEIILVVIGILFALQINNWNETRKQNEQFKLALEQTYNELDIEVQNFEMQMAHLDKQIRFIDQLLHRSGSIPLAKIPYYLFYVDKGTDLHSYANRHSVNFTSDLRQNINDNEQLILTKEIASYLENIDGEPSLEDLIKPILKKHNIPEPSITFGLTSFNDFEHIDTTFFTREEQVKILKLVKSPEIKVALRSIRSDRIKTKQTDFSNVYQDARSVLSLIKEYDPDVRLFYEDVGIIGTALDGFDDAGGKSTPMEIIDEEKSLWQIEVVLHEGTVKFRTRDSWNQNWGGNTFPEGKALYYWDNIHVAPGKYRVTLNLSKRRYKFEKLFD